jgi:hypothetical protein
LKKLLVWEGETPNCADAVWGRKQAAVMDITSDKAPIKVRLE